MTLHLERWLPNNAHGNADSSGGGAGIPPPLPLLSTPGLSPFPPPVVEDAAPLLSSQNNEGGEGNAGSSAGQANTVRVCGAISLFRKSGGFELTTHHAGINGEK